MAIGSQAFEMFLERKRRGATRPSYYTYGFDLTDRLIRAFPAPADNPYTASDRHAWLVTNYLLDHVFSRRLHGPKLIVLNASSLFPMFATGKLTAKDLLEKSTFKKSLMVMFLSAKKMGFKIILLIDNQCVINKHELYPIADVLASWLVYNPLVQSSIDKVAISSTLAAELRMPLGFGLPRGTYLLCDDIAHVDEYWSQTNNRNASLAVDLRSVKLNAEFIRTFVAKDRYRIPAPLFIRPTKSWHADDLISQYSLLTYGDVLFTR